MIRDERMVRLAATMAAILAFLPYSAPALAAPRDVQIDYDARQLGTAVGRKAMHARLEREARRTCMQVVSSLKPVRARNECREAFVKQAEDAIEQRTGYAIAASTGAIPSTMRLSMHLY